MAACTSCCGGVDVAVQVELQRDLRVAEARDARHLRERRHLPELPLERRRHGGRHRLGAARRAGTSRRRWSGSRPAGSADTGSCVKAARPTSSRPDHEQRGRDRPPDERLGDARRSWLGCPTAPIADGAGGSGSTTVGAADADGAVRAADAGFAGDLCARAAAAPARRRRRARPAASPVAMTARSPCVARHVDRPHLDRRSPASRRRRTCPAVRAARPPPGRRSRPCASTGGAAPSRTGSARAGRLRVVEDRLEPHRRRLLVDLVVDHRELALCRAACRRRG